MNCKQCDQLFYYPHLNCGVFKLDPIVDLKKLYLYLIRLPKLICNHDPYQAILNLNLLQYPKKDEVRVICEEEFLSSALIHLLTTV